MARVRISLGCLLLVVAIGCATIDETSSIKPNERPALATMEGGLWMQIDNIEKKFKRSGWVVRDAALNSYINKIVCDLAGSFCPDFRVYIVSVPAFNATMAPNGMMQVYTGLLLRVQNEAQLAAVLGHEITHYIKQHSLKRIVDTMNKANFLSLLSVGLGVTGYGAFTNIATLIASGTIAAYSRDHEREADAGGMDLLIKKGYSPEEAPRIWQNLIKEGEAGGHSSPPLFLATHPPSDERIQNLKNQASHAHLSANLITGQEAYLKVTARFRGKWIEEELRLRQFDQLEVILNHLGPSKIYPGEIEFFRGEIMRLREKDGDWKGAMVHYKKAIEKDPIDPRPQRAMGLMLLKSKPKEKARKYLETYLSLKPEAEDKSIIKGILKRLN